MKLLHLPVMLRVPVNTALEETSQENYQNFHLLLGHIQNILIKTNSMHVSKSCFVMMLLLITTLINKWVSMHHGTRKTNWQTKMVVTTDMQMEAWNFREETPFWQKSCWSISMRVLFAARRKIFSQQIVFLQKPVKSAWNFRVRRQRRVREEPVRAIDRDKKKQSWYPIVKYSLPTLIREILEKTSHHMMVHWWQWVRNLLQPHWCLPHDPFLFPCLLPFWLSCSWQPIICVCACILLCCFFSLLLVHWSPTMQQIKESSSALWSLSTQLFSSCQWWWQKDIS